MKAGSATYTLSSIVEDEVINREEKLDITTPTFNRRKNGALKNKLILLLVLGNTKMI